jgi:hypothetical protein
MNYTIPSSEKLKSLEKKRAELKATAAISSAEILRLTNLGRPGSIGETVVNRTRPATHATIETWSDPSTNRSSDLSAQESARNADRDAILSGQPLAERTDVKMLLAQQNRRRGALEDGLESIERDIRIEKTRLAIEYSKELRPEYDKEIGIVFKALVDLYPTLLRLNGLKQHLVDNGIGFREGVFAINPEALFDNALNKYSPLATFLNEGVRLQYIKQLPKEFVL